MQTEKEVMTEVKHIESSIIKHIASDDAVKLSALSAEILALKDALNSALNSCQVLNIIPTVCNINCVKFVEFHYFDIFQRLD